MGLVVAVVVARPDIDEAQNQRLLRPCLADEAAAAEAEGGRPGSTAEQAATADVELVDHGVASANVSAPGGLIAAASGMPLPVGALQRPDLSRFCAGCRLG